MLKYQKFQAPISKMRCIVQKDQMLWFVQKPNEKLLRFVIIFLWEVIYAHFYNWDSPSDLVLVVYDLIELIIEASLWTKDYSTFDTHRSNVQWMLISFVCLCMFKCDVCVLNHIWIKPKRFLFFFYLFYLFIYLLIFFFFCIWKWLVSTMFFKVFQVVFVWKTCFLSIFVTFSCVSSVTS